MTAITVKGAAKKTGKIAMYALTGFYAISCIYPVFWLLLASFKTSTEFTYNILGFPRVMYYGNYEYVFTELALTRYMFNTLRITICVLLLTLLFSFINGYFIARFRFRLRNLIYATYTCNLFIPVHAILVPSYIMFIKIGMYNQWYSTILPIVCMQLTTSTFLVQSYVSSMPVEMEEAAAIDGSSFTRTLFTIVFPIVRPIISTIAIMTFFASWNEFVFSQILFQTDDLFTLSMALLRYKGEYFTDYPRIMTTIFVCIIPALLIYVLFSKYIIKGMTAGAIKG